MRPLTSKILTTILFAMTPTASNPQNSNITTTTIYQSPLPPPNSTSGTWFENLLPLPNGHILLTTLSTPSLVIIDPLSPSPSPSLLHTFPSPATSLVGIAASSHTDNVFYIASLDAPNLRSGQLWRLDLSAYLSSPTLASAPGPATLLANLPDSIVLNGISTIPGSRQILLADYFKGVIWRIDDIPSPAPVEPEIAMAIDALARPADATTPDGGVNGILAPGDGYLYFTNTGAKRLARVPIDGEGSARGEVQGLWADGGVRPDDFALWGCEGKEGRRAVVADMNGRVVGVGEGGEGVEWSVDVGSVDVGAPTAVKWGRKEGDERSLYVSTRSGGLVKIEGLTK